MKVLLINGSPHREGCTYTALCEVSRALNDNGVDTDIFWIGNKALSGCIACKKCQGTGKCVFNDSVNEFLEIAGDYDGFVFGTPVHWAGATGALPGRRAPGSGGIADHADPGEQYGIFHQLQEPGTENGIEIARHGSSRAYEFYKILIMNSGKKES